jgi:glycosyltransferase involved in cell wall biosynthesis
LVYVKGSASPIIENRPIHTSFLQRLPAAKKRYRHYLPLFPLAAESINLKSFDLVISSSHAVAKSVRTEGVPHWCYIHSPMRYVWDRFDDYFGPEIVGQAASKLFFSPIAAYLRSYDRRTANRVDHFTANSSFVAERVREFYGRSAEVIFPPTDVQRFAKLERKPEDFYLFFSAWVPYKKADHAIKACQDLGQRLIVLGKGPEAARLKKIADAKFVTFVEEPTDQLVEDYFSRAKGLLFPGIEDFGIVPVEAMASGLPVIAFRAGGVLDTLTDQTAQFYTEQTVEGLKSAILEFEKVSNRFEDKILRHQAEKFSRQRFKDRVQTSLATFLSSL